MPQKKGPTGEGNNGRLLGNFDCDGLPIAALRALPLQRVRFVGGGRVDGDRLRDKAALCAFDCEGGLLLVAFGDGRSARDLQLLGVFVGTKTG